MLLSFTQAADNLLANGCPKNRVVEWVAIGMGESSLETRARSPAGALGWLQIMPFNAVAYGYAPADMYNPGLCAYVAMRMSGGGQNCAAWDSAYRNIAASGRYTFLAWPELGSADYANMGVAAARLGGAYSAGVAAPPAPGVAGSLPAAIAALQRAGDRTIPATTAAAAGVRAQLGRMYRLGAMRWARSAA